MAERISQRYRPHVDAIAQLYIDEAGNKTRAAERVRRELGLTSYKSDTLRRWLGVEEFAAAVRIAEESAADRKRTRPAVRGPEKLAWLLTVEKTLKERHKTTEKSEEEKVLGAILRVGAEIRAEESHYETMQVARAKRDFARFLRNLIRWIARRHASTYSVTAPVLKEALLSLDSIIAGDKG